MENDFGTLVQEQNFIVYEAWYVFDGNNSMKRKHDFFFALFRTNPILMIGPQHVYIRFTIEG